MFAVLALALYAAFIVLAGAGRAWIQYRRTGDTGIRHRRHATRGGGRWAGLAPIGSLGPGLVAPIAELLGIPALDVFDASALRWIGVVLAGLGVGVTVVAQLAMGGSWRIGVDPDERTALVTDGPFRVVRNPIFAAVILTTAGLCLAVPNLLALAGFTVLVCGIELEVRLVEEPYLRRAHGADYQRYAARVGRFLPAVGRLPTPHPPA